MPKPAYTRVVLKLSGEALMGREHLGIDPEIVGNLAKEIQSIHELGIDIAIVVGGGNIFRGLAGAANGMDRAQADYIGMLATVMNALALQDAFEKDGMEARVMSAISMPEVCEPYIRRRALRHLEKGRICIVAAGTGNPYFTTDSAAVLRACELEADCLMKATNVDGVYDKDPKVHKDAKRYEHITFKQVLIDRLHVMDAAAIGLCQDNNMPLVVFNIHKTGIFKDAVLGNNVGTMVGNKE